MTFKSFDISGNPYSFTTGPVVLQGNQNFNISNSTGGGSGNVIVGSLNDSAFGSGTIITKSGSGTLTLSAAATSMNDGDTLFLPTGVVRANAVDALGSIGTGYALASIGTNGPA